MTRTRLDGYELFTMIGSHRNAFADHQAAVDKAASAILLAEIKSKHLTLERSRQLRDVIGKEFFALALDSLSDSDLVKLIKKLDPHYGSFATASPNDLRLHISALTGNRAQPAPKPVKPAAKAPARKTPAKQEASWPTSVSAKPLRRAS